MSDTTREALERMLTLKQNDWIEACGEIDTLKEKLAEAEKLNKQLGENLQDTVRDLNLYFEQKTELANERKDLEIKLSEALEVIRSFNDGYHPVYDEKEGFIGDKKAIDFLKKHGLEKV